MKVTLIILVINTCYFKVEVQCKLALSFAWTWWGLEPSLPTKKPLKLQLACTISWAHYTINLELHKNKTTLKFQSHVPWIPWLSQTCFLLSLPSLLVEVPTSSQLYVHSTDLYETPNFSTKRFARQSTVHSITWTPSNNVNKVYTQSKGLMYSFPSTLTCERNYAWLSTAFILCWLWCVWMLLYCDVFHWW